MNSYAEQLASEKKKKTELAETLISREAKISSLKASLLPTPAQPDVILLVRQLYISHWEKVKTFYLTLQPTLRFIDKASRLNQEAHDAMEQFLRFILEKVPEARDLFNKLYSISDEILAEEGIDDRDIAAQIANKFIHCHSAFQRTKAAAAFLSKALDGIRESFFELGKLGLPSPFLEDDSIATTAQIVEVIEQKENDSEVFNELGSSPTVANIEAIIHPLS